MNKLKTFGKTFIKSISSPKYYNDILKAKFSFSFKYLAIFLFILNLITTIRVGVFLYRNYPKVTPFVSEVKQIMVDFYPKELVLTIKKQKITTNVKEPYYIDFPPKISEKVSGVYKHLIAIDTKGKTDNYKNYESLALITADKVVMPDDKGEGNYQVILLEDKLTGVPEGTKIDKNLYDKEIKKALPYVDQVAKYLSGFAIAGVILLPFIATVLSLWGKLFYLLFATLIIWFLAKILKKKLDYGKLYRLGIHGLTLPIVANFGLNLFNLHIPFIYSLIFFIWMTTVLTKIKE